MRTPMENGFASMATPRCAQHLEGVAGAVADGEHDAIGRDVRAVGEHDAAHMAQPVAADLDVEVVDPALEPVLAAERFDGAAHVLDDGDEAERADVRLAEA